MLRIRGGSLRHWQERRSHPRVRLDRRQALQGAERSLMFEQVAEFCPAGIVAIGANGRIRYTNRHAEQLLGLDGAAEGDNAPVWQVTDFEDRPIANDDLIFTRALHSDLPISDVQHAVTRPDGTRLYLLISAAPVLDAEGRIEQTLFTMMDVSASVAAIRARQDSERRYQSLLDHMNEGVCTVTDDFQTINYVNPRLAQMLGEEVPALLGRSIYDFVPPEQLQIAHDHMQGVREQSPQRFDLECLLRNRRRLYISAAVTPLLSHEGLVTGAVAAITDITDRHRIELALRESQQRFSKALENAPIGMALVALDGRFSLVNQALCDIVGYDKAHLERLTFQDITHPDDIEADLTQRGDVVAGRIKSYQMEKRYVRRDATPIWVRLSVTLLRDELGKPLHFIAQIEDIHDRKLADERLRLSEERLRLMLDSVVDYEILILDPRGVVTSWNPGAQRIKGYTAEELIGRHISVFYPQEAVAAGIPQQEPDIANQSGRYSDEGWRLRKDGSRFWAAVVLTPLRLSSGDLIGYCKVTRDLTETRRTELELRDGKQQLERSLQLVKNQHREISALGELSNILQSCLTVEEIYRPVRRYCRELFPGYAGAMYLMPASRNHLECVVTWDHDNEPPTLFVPEDCWGLRRGQLHSCCGEDDLRCPHLGDTQTGCSLCIPMIAQSDTLGMLHLIKHCDGTSASANNDGEGLQRNRLAVMVAERIGMAIANLRLRETLRIQSVRDPLTQLYNRRYLEEALQRELVHVARNGGELSVLMIDVDHFKRYNDSFGHEGGDAALIALAQVLLSATRGGDIACRLGGEEFVVVYRGCPSDAALIRAEELRRRVAETEVQGHGNKLPPTTISIGISLYPHHGQHMDDLLRSADHALYTAKGAGRNRVQLARVAAG